jgi:anti-sigma-K factor RskA
MRLSDSSDGGAGHCDPGVLSLVSLGERPGEQDARHLATCTVCQADVADLADVVAAVRVDIADGPPVPPPPRVWDAIAAQTGVSVSPATFTRSQPEDLPRTLHQQPAPPPQPAWSQQTWSQPTTPDGPESTVVRLRPRRPQRSGLWRTLAVAATALVVGAAGGSAVTHQLTGDSDRPDQVVLAQAGLKGLALAPSSGGRAMVVRTADGPKLDVDVSALGALDGKFYEVWLIDSSIKKMVPVGILRGSTGEFVIPDGLDLADYPLVDISIQEPGNPAHSGKSVLRGTLPA